ncbi:tetratricopeptide repeat protein [Niastella sp. OAS944]|uniref:tetratricopeptide repeat protein n=1 Tax=Niastella sp. OAS944 TaxID=2664089 RepID=UPI00349B6695|nr:hypothetical protein [Chitinophagaceae bacterium OAS944]
MKKILIAFALTFSFLFKSFACLNGATYGLKDGTLLYVDERDKVPHGHKFRDTAQYNGIIKKLDKLYKTTKDLDYLSDKGLLLVLLKKYDEAIDLYLDIEKREPNRYSTASNIGTAYELAGQNEKALHWIKRAVEIEPNSHYSSEWIHVKILEAKIKGEQFYTTDFLLNTNFGNDSKPKSGLSTERLTDLYNQLSYQLNERMSFVKPKDKLVAQLLFDLGNAAYELGWYNYAQREYELAQKYGFEGDLINVRIAESIWREENKQLQQKEVPNETIVKNDNKAGKKASLIITGFFILMTAVLFIYKKRTYRYKR